VSGTWGSPKLPTGLDMYDRKQEPRPEPVDDLSRFVLDRIHDEETQPRVDGIPQAAAKSRDVVAYRYAGYVRRDMATYRRIVKRYCDVKTEWESSPNQDERQVIGVFSAALAEAVREIAMRWSDHHEFRDEWRLR